MGYPLEFHKDSDSAKFNDLVNDIRQEKEHAFFIFLGAGFSFNIKQDIIANFTDSSFERAYWENKLPLGIGLINSMKSQIGQLEENGEEASRFAEAYGYTDIAQYLKTLNLTRYYKILRDAFQLEPNRIPSKGIPISIESLFRLRLNTVITSNYDRLIEFYYNKKFGDFPEVVFMKNQPINRSTSSTVLKLIKMHGCISNPATIVLAREDYAKSWQENVAIFRHIGDSLQRFTCLFIGYSMKDDDFNHLYDEIRYTTSFGFGKSNYAVVSAGTQHITSLDRKYWSMRGLEMIAIRSWNHLNGFMNQLANEVSK